MDNLFPWQKSGVKWLCNQEEEFGCGILADEMGLGKTLQVIGLIKRRICKTILIVPLALLDQWCLELNSISIRPLFLQVIGTS